MGPVSAFLIQINQISDSSPPTNCSEKYIQASVDFLFFLDRSEDNQSLLHELNQLQQSNKQLRNELDGYIGTLKQKEQQQSVYEQQISTYEAEFQKLNNSRVSILLSFYFIAMNLSLFQTFGHLDYKTL